MNRKLLLLLILFLGSFGNAQNIITNGSFEDNSAGWGTIKTVDFHGTQFGSLGTMNAQNGTRFCGLRFYSVDQPISQNWQEYIWQGIAGSMIAGATYKVSIYHCLADMCTRTTDDFGVLFGEAPYYFGANFVGSWLSTLTPQVRLKDGVFPTDDVDWTELSGYYQASGNEIYTVVGCFKVDNTLDTIGIQSDYQYTQGDVYFFIDNFSVTECVDYPQIDMEDEKVLCEEGEVSLDAYYPGATYLWSTGDTTSAITKSINQTAYLSVMITKNGCTYQDSTKITLFSQGIQFDDIWLCDADKLPIERSVAINQNEQLLWEDGSNSSTRLISESGEYSYKKSLGNCSYTDTFQVIVFNNDVLAYPNPGVDYIKFTNSDNVKVTSIFSSDGKLIINNLINGENLDSLIKQLSPGIYFLNIEENGCRKSLKYEKQLIK